jgi:hypothetical protein
MAHFYDQEENGFGDEGAGRDPDADTDDVPDWPLDDDVVDSEGGAA